MNEIIRDRGGDESHFELTLTGTTVCGDIVQRPDGTPAVFLGMRSYASGEIGPFTGVADVNLDAASGTLFAAGEMVAYNPSTKLAIKDDNTVAGAIRVGRAITAKTNGQLFVFVAMGNQPPAPENTVRSIRRRFTTAEINAGATLLPALPGFRYRVIDARMTAIGGAATTSTTIDINATQASTGVKLVANAVAGLTQSTLLRAGAANSAILADGASFAPNDSNTAITVGRTGSNMTVATAIDVSVDYVVEAA